MTPDQINHITRAYAYTDADKTALTQLLASTYLHAKETAYQRAHTTAGTRVSFSPWQPGSEDQDKAHKWATPMAESIAETYEALLRSQLEQMDDSEPQEAIGDVWQGVKDVAGKIAEWVKGFLPWKTEQIAQNTWSEGDNDGTEQFVEDAKSSGTDYSTMRVRVLPETSSSDQCAAYAGNDYGFDEVGDSVPELPLHNKCIHYLQVYTVNANGEEEPA